MGFKGFKILLKIKNKNEIALQIVTTEWYKML